MGKMVAPGIEKLGRRHYRLWWTESGTGRRRTRVVRVELEEAKRIRAAIIDSQTKGTYVGPDTMTLREYLDAWLDRRAMMGDAKESTIRRYRQLLASVSSKLGDIRLQELKRADVESYYAWCLTHEVTRLGTLVSADTVHKRHKVLKQALDDAVNQEPPVIGRNPAAKAAHPSPAKPHAQAFTRDEAMMIVGAVNETPLEIPVLIALHTGLRIGEVLGLRWRDVDLPASGPGSLAVLGQVVEEPSGVSVKPYAKTSCSRAQVSFGHELADRLRSHRKVQAQERVSLGPAWEPGDLVVCGSHGQVIRPSKLTAAFSAVVEMLETAGVLTTSGATFHTLRHTHATILLRERVPVHIVSRRMRHSRIQITLDLYAHVIPSDDQAAAEGFDEAFARPFIGGENHVGATMHMLRTSDGPDGSYQDRVSAG